jgi:predicted transcriptional regulator
LIILLPAAEEAAEEAEEEALAEEVALVEEAVAALAEEAAAAVSAIQVEVPVRFKAVNPAVVQVDLKEAVKVPLGVQVVGVLEAGNLAVVVLAVFAILAEVPVRSKVVNPVVVQVV